MSGATSIGTSRANVAEANVAVFVNVVMSKSAAPFEDG